jgi:hypothetical protein
MSTTQLAYSLQMEHSCQREQHMWAHLIITLSVIGDLPRDVCADSESNALRGLTQSIRGVFCGSSYGLVHNSSPPLIAFMDVAKSNDKVCMLMMQTHP